MDKLAKYKSIVQSMILEYGSFKESIPTLKNCIIMDAERGQYLLLSSGWVNESRMYGPYLHFEVQNDKVYIHYNGTDIHVGHELASRGIPKEDIVLEFQAPYKRPYTGFASA